MAQLSKGEMTPPCGTPFLPEAFSMIFRRRKDVPVVNPLRHFLQQPVVPDVVKIGS